MNTTRILISSELESYREVLAEAFRTFYPDLDVFEAEPYDLDRKVERIRPDLVVCSRVTNVIKKNVLVWVELYSDGSPRSVISVSGRRKEIESLELSELLSFADQAKALAQKRENKSRRLRGSTEDTTAV